MTSVNPTVACIVEGHGEREAVPALVRRIGAALEPPVYPVVPPAIRIPKTRLLRPGELERAVILARSRVVESGQGGGVLVVIDADDDCAAEAGPGLLQSARAAAGGVPAEVVLAVREFEAWFLASLESLRGHRGIDAYAEAPDDPESIRGAKEALRARMMRGYAYSAPTDQPALAAVMDLVSARSSRSFDKLWRSVASLANTRSC